MYRKEGLTGIIDKMNTQGVPRGSRPRFYGSWINIPPSSLVVERIETSIVKFGSLKKGWIPRAYWSKKMVGFQANTRKGR